MITYSLLRSPVGRVLVAWSGEGLVWVGVGREVAADIDPTWRHDRHLRCAATDQLEAYFAGHLRRFDIPLVLNGTAFQKTVWKALASIPYGEAITYGELARRVGRPGAARAVGAACGSNPIGIVLPCHRVVGHDGSLVGYGGGLRAKAALLAMERAFVQPVQAARRPADASGRRARASSR